MHLALLLLCALATLAVAWVAQRRHQARKELVLMLLLGLFAAYPLKGYLLRLDPTLFATYENYEVTSDRIEVYFAYIAFVILVAIGFLMPRTRPVTPAAPVTGASAGWAYLNLANALAILTVAVTFSGISAPEELLGAAARSQFLFAQQGSGWTSLLIVFTMPLLVLGYRAGRPALLYAAFACALVALLIIGSRLYLFGYIIAFLICRFTLTLRGTVLVLASLGAAGALIYMGFVGDALDDVGGLRMLSFVMHTFDGADILNSYINKGQHALYFGSTVVEDLLLTYFPRALWEGKPYLFGAIRITTDLFSDLADVQGLGATFPPGLFLELYANFGVFAVAAAVLMGALVAWVSDERRIAADPLAFAFYVSLCATAPGFFRGLGAVISVALPVLALLALLTLARRLRT